MTQIGALKGRALRLGLTYPEYMERHKLMKWCSGCKDWHLKSAFTKVASSWDGLDFQCRTYKAERGAKAKLRREALQARVHG